MNPFFRLAITSGDPDGIGPEVTAKALAKIKKKRNVQLYLWRSNKFPKKFLSLIDKSFHRTTVDTWAQALRAPIDFKSIIEIESVLPPAKWVEQMGRAGLVKGIDALVTAPLSKTGILNAGLKDSGHTGILKRVTKSPNVYMTFLGENFSVVLLTGHVSIKKAFDQINEEKLIDCISLVNKARDLLPSRSKDKPIALVGCNPHAGEEGVISDFEKNTYHPAVKALGKRRVKVLGPLVPDVCFQPQYWRNFSFYIASYHDQGLIPFKMVHSGKGGIQISLGLPFIRTSVDHGTAKDIFGKNRADESSMKRAIEVAIKNINNKN